MCVAAIDGPACGSRRWRHSRLAPAVAPCPGWCAAIVAAYIGHSSMAHRAGPLTMNGFSLQATQAALRVLALRFNALLLILAAGASILAVS